jgi:hypothetical protein
MLRTSAAYKKAGARFGGTGFFAYFLIGCE